MRIVRTRDRQDMVFLPDRRRWDIVSNPTIHVAAPRIATERHAHGTRRNVQHQVTWSVRNDLPRESPAQTSAIDAAIFDRIAWSESCRHLVSHDRSHVSSLYITNEVYSR
jgi:hypothetical protein